MTGRQRVLTHLQGGAVDCLPAMPITMQFASALIGAPYRVYATDHRTLASAQIHVAETFDFDHVSVISDPAREPSDLGARIIIEEDSPPSLNETDALIASKSDLGRLPDAASVFGERMTDRVQGVELLKRLVGQEKLVEGWIEGPCAEGADLRGINTLMTDLVDDPDFVRDLFEYAVALELGFARKQVEAGADIIGIGDAAASLVGPRIYDELVLPYEERMVAGVHDMGALVRLHICGNTRRILHGMGLTGSDIVDLDYFSSMADGRKAMGPNQMLLGNIDPVRVLRDLSPDDVTDAIRDCHAGAGPRYIVGAGCEVPRDTPHENVRAMIRYAREHLPDGSPASGSKSIE